MDLYMAEALKLAEKAYKKNEVPIGAIVVRGGKIIGRGYNKKEKTSDVTMHAEIIAIKQACKKLRSWYLNDCILYITLEPCMMCMGAILQSHVKKVVFSTYSEKYGYCKKISTGEYKNVNFEVGSGDKESTELLREFFKNKRK